MLLVSQAKYEETEYGREGGGRRTLWWWERRRSDIGDSQQNHSTTKKRSYGIPFGRYFILCLWTGSLVIRQCSNKTLKLKGISRWHIPVKITYNAAPMMSWQIAALSNLQIRGKYERFLISLFAQMCSSWTLAHQSQGLPDFLHRTLHLLLRSDHHRQWKESYA